MHGSPTCRPHHALMCSFSHSICRLSVLHHTLHHHHGKSFHTCQMSWLKIDRVWTITTFHGGTKRLVDNAYLQKSKCLKAGHKITVTSELSHCRSFSCWWKLDKFASHSNSILRFFPQATVSSTLPSFHGSTGPAHFFAGFDSSNQKSYGC